MSQSTAVSECRGSIQQSSVNVPALGRLELAPQRLFLLIGFVREMLPSPPADRNCLGWTVAESSALSGAFLLAIVLKVYIGAGRGRMVGNAHGVYSKLVCTGSPALLMMLEP